jgi:DNA-binding NarL/FixJ family response regulator
VDITEEDYLMHYGILRRSGRYPWGSGGNVSSPRTFLESVEKMRKEGLSETDIAKGFGLTTTELRASKSIARNADKQAKIGEAQRLQDRGWSNVAIGKRMGIPESTVRSYLAPGAKDKADVLHSTAQMLRDEVAKKGMVDVSIGVERLPSVGVSKEKLATAVAILKQEGYELHTIKIEQQGTGKLTTTKVLAKPGTTRAEVWKNRGDIQIPGMHTEDGGRTYHGIQPPLSISSKRIAVRYAEDGGGQADGVIYVRRGVNDVSLGGNNYAQVRIAVNGTHFLKGMAMYRDDLPDGVDLVFNTSKHNTGNKLDAMKPLKDDPDLPFGAVISRQVTKDLPGGKKKVTSSMNIVNDEGDWEKWSRSLSSQFLSKQSPSLAKGQLDMAREHKQSELDEIMNLTNPTVRKKLLLAFAESADASVGHLKAAHMPNQKTHVILPINSMKDTEVYAPNYKNGERVVLVRFPHGGKFEIPELTVNNRNPEARRLLGNASSAIGINHKVAQRLSGADFDGDTVLVIPNNHGHIKSQPALSQLKGFDPIASYPPYHGMPKMSAATKGHQMGLVSNLITDMTLRGASNDELARAVRHSMVVIDAEKHNLNYKQSAIDNGIAQLMEKYQGKKGGGASTVLSKRKSTVDVPERKPRSAAKGGPIDKTTGKLMFEPTGRTFVDRNTGKTVVRTTKVRKILETDDVGTLSSGTAMEKIYVDHANQLKTMANAARRAAVNTKSSVYSPSAKTAYAKEVASLDSKLNVSLRNAPLERRAQAIASAQVSQKRHANPEMEASELKKVKAQALNDARIRTGAKKTRIEITDSEWAAIQAGAVTSHKLNEILKNADMDQVKALATPKTPLLMTGSKKRRALAMLKSGFTQAEVAAQLGVSLTTLKNSLES